MKPVFTSASSPIDVDMLTADLLHQPGQIAMTMAPGKQDEEKEMIWSRSLQADLKRLREQFGINRLVCLLEEEELQRLGVPDLLTEAEARGVDTEHLPMPDEGLPDSMAAFAALVDRVVTALSGGETVLIHCKGGRGRTGMLAAACLVKLGYSPEDAIATVRQIRSGALSTAVKRDYVVQFHEAQTSSQLNSLEDAMAQVLMIGGSDAGISAALRIRELSPQTEVTVMLADAYPNFSICGLPFYLSGEVPDWRNLAHRTKEDIQREGISLLANHRATRIDPGQQVVTAVNATGNEVSVSYDKLVIGTGATSRHPRIEGLDLPGVYFLRWMGDSFQVHQHLSEQNPQSAIIVGGGYIGLEMADALTLRGLQVTLVEHSPTVLKTVHAKFGDRVADELKRHGVNVETGIAVERIEPSGKQLRVTGTPGFSAVADLVLVAVGAVPATDLAQSAGVALGQHGAIQVNRHMATSVPNIYAAGDCVETWHRLLQKTVYIPLGTTAHKQGRIAGENAVGGDREFQGTLGTQVVKVFELAIARTGLREAEAKEAGFEPITVECETWDHKVYYPGAHPIRIRVTGDVHTHQLLGAQIIGHYQGEVAKRIDIFAAALFHEMKVDQLSDLDLSYTPPLSSPWDPVQMAAQAWSKQMSRPTAISV